MNDAENLKALEANKKDEFWRVIYIFPMIINFIMLVSFTIFIRGDPIMFSISENRDEEALELIEKVYDSSENSYEILT